MAKAKGKKTAALKSDKVRVSMKLVTSDVCERCKTPCTRGMGYAARMRVDGAIGKGVPCILTRHTSS
ncbi:hypothetical protein ASD24_06660 [Paenibacillus sp. Root52]|uniref:Uncharacterized protein n=1 Tax=Paenibacillus amylolyticus TaxID=1451 RepID=A0AAP5H2X4_PAEAM|nr:MULTISPECIES: hypothetical protein [Paenibacillus]KQY87528.1 hypothetical protein ASD24_06660 [Paenibacillus sp. Root52]MCG7375837.1 hypothetical protein [Paenibacillus sp. ACRSA]MDR6725318.1 hypothetical protein [Paenibacillus amylolyticus]